MDRDQRARVGRVYRRIRDHAFTRWWRRWLYDLIDLELRRIELWQQREQQR